MHIYIFIHSLLVTSVCGLTLMVYAASNCRSKELTGPRARGPWMRPLATSLPLKLLVYALLGY